MAIQLVMCFCDFGILWEKRLVLLLKKIIPTTMGTPKGNFILESNIVCHKSFCSRKYYGVPCKSMLTIC